MEACFPKGNDLFNTILISVTVGVVVDWSWDRRKESLNDDDLTVVFPVSRVKDIS